HRAVDGIDVAGIALAVPGDDLLPRLQRDVYREMRLVQKEWRLLVGGHESDALVTQPLREEIAGSEFETGQFERPERRRWRAGRAASDVLAKAAIGWKMPFAAEMPFSDGRRAVASRRKHLGDGLVGYWKKLIEVRAQQLRRGPLLAAPNHGGSGQPCRVVSG